MHARDRLKLVMTPLGDRDPDLKARFRLAREKMLRRQVDIAALLSTEGHPVSQQQVAAFESGRTTRLDVTWARLEAVFGPLITAYVLVARDAALYDRGLIRARYEDHFQRAMRKRRHGPDPKKGEAPPWPMTLSSRDRRPRLRRRKDHG